MPRKPTGRPAGRPPHPELLAPSEDRVLAFVREGKTNAEIAVRLGISPDGVKYHVSNMLGKLGLSKREELARWRPSRGDRGRRWLAVPAALIPGSALVVAGGIAAVAIAVLTTALLLSQDDGDDALVAIPVDALFEDGVYCVPEHRFCVVEPLGGGDLIAISTLTSHEIFRQREECQVRWRRATDENHLGQYLLPGEVGVFREPCGGATFLRDGTKVFGPAERSLDRHPIVDADGGALHVDTSTYVAGPPLPETINLCDYGDSTPRLCIDEWTTPTARPHSH